jgi:hypothetical protein
MFKLLLALIDELYGSKPAGIEPNSLPLARMKFMPRLDAAFAEKYSTPSTGVDKESNFSL